MIYCNTVNYKVQHYILIYKKFLLFANFYEFLWPILKHKFQFHSIHIFFTTFSCATQHTTQHKNILCNDILYNTFPCVTQHNIKTYCATIYCIIHFPVPHNTQHNIKTYCATIYCIIFSFRKHFTFDISVQITTISINV